MASQPHIDTVAGQTAWTRDLARDLFPLAVTPFHWTLLRRPAEAAMRRAWADLGAHLPTEPFWRLNERGLVYLNAALTRQAARELHGAAWLGAAPGPSKPGLLGRLQAQTTIGRAQKQVDTAVGEVEQLNRRLTAWLGRIHQLRWLQADLLQVMEELEPQAEAILRAYFTLRAGLSAAHAEVTAHLIGLLPADPERTALHLYAGIETLPSAAMAYAIPGLRDAAAGDESVTAFLTRFGHRGPGEARPEALRWRDLPEQALRLALLPSARDGRAANAAREAAERSIVARLDAGRRRQFDAALARARQLCRSVDVAWDGIACVTAAAQVWLHAAASEAQAAGLIAAPDEVHYLELEELKQVATGEWHRGRSARVRADVASRRAAYHSAAGEPPRPPCPASPGEACGPILRLAPQWGVASLQEIALVSDSILLCESADPGSTPYWLAAAAVVDSAGDPWSPGMIAARALAVPAVTGAPAEIAVLATGQHVAINGGTGRIERVMV